MANIGKPLKVVEVEQDEKWAPPRERPAEQQPATEPVKQPTKRKRPAKVGAATD